MGLVHFVGVLRSRFCFSGRAWSDVLVLEGMAIFPMGWQPSHVSLGQFDGCARWAKFPGAPGL